MNLFNLDNLSCEEIQEIIDLAIAFKNGKEVDFQQKKIVANLFFEPSTRTHYSFDVAANKLGCKTLNLVESNCSTQKGETLYDTVRTFESLGVDAMVVRHPQNEYYNELTNIKTPILSGGDGSGNHPTQSLLDLVTIYEEYGKFEGLKIVICGDIKHSRVARTNYLVMKRLGMDVKFSAPQEYKADYGTYVNLDDVIDTVDIVMLLRVQLERHVEVRKMSEREYNGTYGLNEQRVAMMHDKAIIMHPAPINRGVEITDEVVECDKSRIYKQSANGVFLRMAVLYNAIK